MLSVGVEKPPNHSLILRVVLPRLAFEELNAALAQRDGDLDTLIPENEVFWWRKEVTNDLQSSEALVRVSDFRAHRLPSPFDCLPPSPIAGAKDSDDVVAVREADRQRSALDSTKAVVPLLAAAVRVPLRSHGLDLRTQTERSRRRRRASAGF